MASHRILLIEDDIQTADFVIAQLEKSSYQVKHINQAQGAIDLILSFRPDLILIDLSLPDGHGFELCDGIRKHPLLKDVKIAILSGRTDDPLVVTGFDLGADDYLSKSLSPSVMLARVKNLLKRKSSHATDKSNLQIGKFVLIGEQGIIKAGESSVKLTFSEIRLLDLLMRTPGKVFSRDQIVEYIHGPNYKVTDRAIDVLVLGIRRKLESFGLPLETVRGAGYRLKVSTHDDSANT